MFYLNACYSLPDILVSIGLFVLVITTIGVFITLMSHLILGAIHEVHDLKEKQRMRETINTQ